MSKLTLSVDDAVISRAKRLRQAARRLVSKMVEAYLAAVANPSSGAAADTPVLRSVRGVLKKAAERDHKRHLANKFR